MDPHSSSKPDSIENAAFIEERITKLGSEPVVKKYEKGRFLGKGGFAKCYEVTNMENKKVMAAKIILKSTLSKSRAKQKLISEIKIHKSLNHNNIVGFEHVFEDQECVYILLELCPNQSMHDLIKRRKRLTEIEVQCYTLQLISGLKYLHSRRVIHRDLKLGNLFINEKMEIKMGDLGLAAKLEFEGEKRRTVCGTPNYIAPEIIEGKGGHSYEVDIWSLGVIIYTLLIGKPAFETADVKLTYKKIKACSYSFPDSTPISENAKDLITKILSLEPSKRPSLDEILQHPFLRNGQHIPKTLPVSTLACPPSSSYLNQWSAPENIIKIPSQPPQQQTQPQPQRIETAPLGVPKNGRFVNTQKVTMTSSDKGLTTAPQSPLAQTQANENVSSVPNLDRQSSRGDKGWNITKSGPWQSSGVSSATSLHGVRPHTVQQRDLKSTQGLKTGTPTINLGSRLRLSGAITGVSRGKITPSSSSDVWVTKWVDYSSKYGMGYVLSNGSAGVFFNDNSKIALDSKGEKFDFIQRSRNEKQDTVNSYTMTEYPKDLQKKVTLLHHFRKYLDGPEKPSIETVGDQEGGNQSVVYVKKWIKTRNATMFRLSNKIVQMNFADKTELILNSDNKLVTYVNKKGERSNYPMTNALESGNSEMAKRLKYTKEILSTMLNGQQPTSIPTLHLQ